MGVDATKLELNETALKERNLALGCNNNNVEFFFYPPEINT
jgi:hypothetical protein